MAYLKMHGGHCCGVTHLYLGATKGPTSKIAAVKKWGYADVSAGATRGALYTNDIPAGHPLPYQAVGGYAPPAYSLDRPQEEVGVRVKALIDGFVKDGRRSGMIAAVTTQYQSAWEPFLEGLGFTCVGKAFNSNSHNTLKMWLLVTGKED